MPDDSEDEENIDFDMDDPFDVRGGVGVEELQVLAAQIQSCATQQPANQTCTLHDITSDSPEDEESIDFELDHPFDVRGGIGVEELQRLGSQLQSSVAPEVATQATLDASPDRGATSSDMEDEEGIDFELDHPFDVRGGMGVEELQRLATQIQPALAQQGDLHRSAVGESDGESTKDTGSEHVEDGDEESNDRDTDDQLEVDGVRAVSGVDSLFAHSCEVVAPQPLRLEFGPTTQSRRKVEIDLMPLTAEKNLGYLMKIHSVGSTQVRGSTFYQHAMDASDFTRVGYTDGILVCGVCCRQETGPAGSTTLHIESIDVLKAYRRRRMASQLLVWVLQQASRFRKIEVSIVVPASNIAAVSLVHDAFAFKLVEERPHQGEAICRFAFNMESGV